MKQHFVRDVGRFAERERLFRGASRVLVAVSGGPDSVALLLALMALRKRFGLEVAAIHFDHQLRATSKDDMDWVRAFCDEREISCFTGEGDVARVAREQKAGIEETARKMRYQFLAFVAAEKRFDALATGHTADDQAETVLMRVLRGTGVRGIRGMLPSGPIPGASALRLIRPLLEQRRMDTVAFCAAAGVSPLIDSSNADIAAATRNRLRHETLPALEALNPSVRQALLGLAQSAREVFDGVEKQSYGAVPSQRGPVGSIFALTSLRGLPAEARTLVIEREAAFYHLAMETNRRRLQDLDRVLRSGTGVVEFADAAVQASCGKVRIGPRLSAEFFEGRLLNVPGATIAGPWRVDVSTAPLEAIANGASASFDAARLRGALRARQLVAGDRMRYHGIERKVADVFANSRLPAWERIGAVAIADSERVQAVLTATAVYAADRSSDADDLRYVRLSPAPTR